MNEFYRAKFNELFAEFTRYLIEHPEFAGQIPDGTDSLKGCGAIELSIRTLDHGTIVATGAASSGQRTPFTNAGRRPSALNKPTCTV